MAKTLDRLGELVIQFSEKMADHIEKYFDGGKKVFMPEVLNAIAMFTAATIIRGTKPPDEKRAVKFFNDALKYWLEVEREN